MEWKWKATVEEQAKEELQSLQAQHPDHFDYLKADLKSLIFLLQSEHQSLFLNDDKSFYKPISSSATTQASSSEKKRKKGGGSEEEKQTLESEVHRREKVLIRNGYLKKKRNSVDTVLEKAQACLRRIQEVKSGLIF